MGCCFSSNTAAAAASNVLQAAANYLDTGSGAQQAPPPAAGQKVITGVHVFKMPDGDTFTCRYPSGETVRVRILGIDCPETRQNYGREAGDLGRRLINNQTVTLHVADTDRYGRVVADVIMPNGQSFGEAMLAAGAAWHYKAYDKRPNLAQLELEARQDKRGLWQFARPQPPWDYRKRIRENGK